MTSETQPPSHSAFTAQWIAVALVGFGVTYSCVERTDDNEDVDPTRAEFLAATGECVRSAVANWSSAAKNLHDTVEDWDESPTDDDARQAAQDAWEEAREIWQRFEPLALGPAGSSSPVEQGGAIGGQDLAEQIYSWPTINACRVDQGLVTESYADGVGELPVNARGLDSLEYLLFNDTDDSSCPPTAAIISEGSWDDLSDRSDRRAAYALAIANDLVALSEELSAAWNAEDGNDFRSHLTNAGESGLYEAQTDALKAVTDALFYVKKVVKDQKLAIPLGISAECAEESCPDDFEHRPSGASKASIANNIEGFALVFAGCGDEGKGVEWLLRQEGAERLADDMVAAIKDG